MTISWNRLQFGVIQLFNIMPFSNIIGQTSIVSRLTASINSDGALLAQPIFFGEAGLGKTAIGKAYANAIAEKLKTEVTFFNSPEEFRHADGDEFKSLLNWFRAKTGILVIDECHKFGDKPTIQMQKVHNFLLKCLDAQNEGKLLVFDTIRVGENEYETREFSHDKSKKVIVMMTNYKNKVNPALASRMDVCELQPYSHAELEKICIQMLASAGMVAECDKTIALLAKASRGTARPLYNMIQHFSRFGIEIVTRDFAIQTMRDLDMFPRGLSKHEIHLLQIARKPTTKSIAQMVVTGLQGNIAKSVAYLMGHGLMEAMSGSQIKTSKKGENFLHTLQTIGFIQ